MTGVQTCALPISISESVLALLRFIGPYSVTTISSIPNSVEPSQPKSMPISAQIVGVRLTGDDQLNRMTVMRPLQTLCGSQAMSMIMPEESNTIRMLDQAKVKAAALQRP